MLLREAPATENSASASRVTPLISRSSAETTEIACGSSTSGTSSLPEATSSVKRCPETTMAALTSLPVAEGSSACAQAVAGTTSAAEAAINPKLYRMSSPFGDAANNIENDFQ